MHLPSATDTRERRITVNMLKNVSPPDRISDLTRIWEIGYVTTLTKDNATTSRPVSLRNDVGTWSGVGKKDRKKKKKKRSCCPMLHRLLKRLRHSYLHYVSFVSVVEVPHPV